MDQQGPPDVLPDPAEAVHEAPAASSWRAARDPLLIGALILALVGDQVTKQIVLQTLERGHSWPTDGFFRFTFVRNTGTAFGFFSDSSTLITFMSLIAVAAIVYFYREAAMSSRITRLALGLQIGGALGNLSDRFTHGYVVDWIDIGPWPIFNLADAAIMTGIAGLVLYFTAGGGYDLTTADGSDDSDDASSDPPDPPVFSGPDDPAPPAEAGSMVSGTIEPTGSRTSSPGPPE